MDDLSSLSRLTQHLSHDRTVRFFLGMKQQFSDQHLKDLVIGPSDDYRRTTVNGRSIVNFGSDSFLGLDRDPRVQKAIIEGVRTWGAHSGASRAFYSVEANAEAERRLARWLGVEDTLIFPSVTLVNTGALPGILDRGDLLIMDRLGHNSMQEGAKIASANGVTVERLDPAVPEALEKILDHSLQRPGLVVAVDGVYSMLGTSPPLKELDEVTRQRGGILYVDDAHGTGIFGSHGRGTASRMLGDLSNILMIGSLSKAFSCMGGFITCTKELKLLLKMKSNTYIFGGPVVPAYLEAICTVCDILESNEYEAIVSRLRQRVERLAQGARGHGYTVLGGESPIVSLLIKGKEKTLCAGKWLFDQGYYVQSVIYPAVPLNSGVLRIQVNANHRMEDIEGLVRALADMSQVSDDWTRPTNSAA